MYLKASVGLIGIITIILTPGLTSNPNSQVEWPRRDMDSGIDKTTLKNYTKVRQMDELNLPVAKSRLEKRQEDFDEAEDFGIRAMNEFYDIKEPKLFKMGLFLNTDHPARYLAAFNRQSDEAKDISKVAYAALEGSRKLIEKYGNESKTFSPSEFERDTTTLWTHRRAGLRERCPRRNPPQCTMASLKYRTADGSCNNPEHLWWGSAMSTMQRFLDPVYEDGVDAIRRSVKTGRPLPSPRDVSTTIHEDKDVPLASVTHMLMQWGQFVDHDMIATAQSQGFNGTFPQCCRGRGAEFQPPQLMHPDCLPIVVDPQDYFFGRFGVRCLEFVRSGPAPREDCGFGPREQLSQVTPYIDGSMIYSSNVRHSDSLRIFRGGLLQYGKLKTRRPHVSRDEPDDMCRRGSLSASCFRAGDARLTEQPALTSLHVVFLRLHNEIATDLSQLNPHWVDERIFQETRKAVGAIIQHITYNEYLPIVLGPEVMKIFDLERKRAGYYNGYDPTVNPNLANSFSSAAYRFGHSLVQRGFSRYDNQHHLLLNNISIHEELSNRLHLHSPGSVDRLLLGLVNQPAQRRDEYITSELTNHLFEFPNFPFGMDLAAINIQRGRDHGLPPYVKWREPCGLSKIRKWQDLERVMSPTIVRKFRRVYESVEDVDLFPAGIAEKSVMGGLVGPTFACIIAQQFSNIKKGDRFWYENEMRPSAFTPQQLNQIRRITLAHILCGILDKVETIQPFVFLTSDTLRNGRVSCEAGKLGEWNFQPWIDTERSNDNFRSSSQTSVDSNINNSDFNNSEKIEQAKMFKAKKPKPIQTNLHQKNRITVKHPVGSSHDNVTIVVNNHAINSPIFVNDLIYGSNFHKIWLNSPISTSAPINTYDRPHSGIYPSVEHYPTKPTYPADSSDSFIPVTLEDPNNPNPPIRPIAPSTTEYPFIKYPKPSNHHNDAWVNIGPLLDQLKPDWYQPSRRPPTISYELRVNNVDKPMKVDIKQSEIPKPLAQHKNNNGDADDDVIVITEEDSTDDGGLLDTLSDSTINDKNADTESEEIPRPMELRSRGI